MTRLPDDLIDQAEGRLVRRVGAYTDQAVFPIDPVAIAASAAATGRRRTFGERLFGTSGAVARLALVGAGAVLVAAGAFVIGGGAKGILPPAPTANDTVVTIHACSPDEVDAVITAWDGAAGNRIATVELRHIGATKCNVDRLAQLWLADGDGTPIIKSGPVDRPGTIAIQPGDILHTLVDVSNYCGATPKAPITVAFIEADTATFVATALGPRDRSGVPPCDGAGLPASIQMHAWSLDPVAP